MCHVTKKKKKRRGKTWSELLNKISLVNVTHRRQVSEPADLLYFGHTL